MSEIYEALKRAEAERAALPPSESRLNREVLNELGAAMGRVEACLATHKANWEGIVVGLNLLGAKFDAIQAALLLGDFERHAVATAMPRPRRSRKGRGRR
jgi:hypothetical protein